MRWGKKLLYIRKKYFILNVSYHFMWQRLGWMNIVPVKSVACFKINSESLEVSWDLGVSWELRSIPSTPTSPSLYLETGHIGIYHPPPLLPTAPTVRSLVTIDLAERSLTLPSAWILAGIAMQRQTLNRKICVNNSYFTKALRFCYLW